MDHSAEEWHYPDMRDIASIPSTTIPVWNLYGEVRDFPDVLHCEKITDRASGHDWMIAPHRHLHLHQFFLFRRGSIEFRIDGNTLQADLPCVMSIPKGVVHGFVFSENTDGLVLTIPLQNLPEVFGSDTPTGHALSKFATSPADDAIDAIFRRLHDEHKGLAPARTVMLRALASQIAVAVIRRQAPDWTAEGKALDPRFLRFQTLVQSDQCRRWRLDSYAREIGISVRHLGRLCQSATGLSAAAFIEANLMREACRLLVYTRAPVAQVGYELGFEDPSYFSRAFQRACGSSPRAYRAIFERA